jgi:drug efflux transport system permease protein
VSVRRIAALVRKESLQILRDPSALAIAFVLPVILLLLFSYAVSLDVRNVPFGVVLQSDSIQARELAAAYGATPFLTARELPDRAAAEPLIRTGVIRGFVVIPNDFDKRLLQPHLGPAIQIISDGSSPNSANFVSGYARGVFQRYLQGHPRFAALAEQPVSLQPRFWFNPELDSRQVLVPGAIALVMTMIGTLLTALVIAREWERGTMEALMSTPASMVEIILSKLLPYFLLGGIAVMGCSFMAVVLLDIPLRGSIFSLLVVSAAFLLPALGQGLLISTITRNQFRAVMAAVLSAYLPAMLLSGFLFEIASMPWIIRKLTLLLPARHYVSSLKTVFLAGDVWSVLARDILAMLLIGAVLFLLTLARSHKRLD